MPELAFVTAPGQDWATRELITTVSAELARQGIPCQVHEGTFPDPRPGLVYALAGPRQWLECSDPADLPSRSLLARTVLLSAEAPERVAQGPAIYLELLRAAGAVFDLNVRSVLALQRAGIPARTLRPGYTPEHDRFDADRERPLALTFYGSASPRRRQALARLAPVLARHNCLISLCDPERSHPEGSPSFLAAGRYDFLAASQILLSLHASDSPHVEWNRMLAAMHGGAVFLTEPSSGLVPFSAGEHLVVSDLEAMPHVIDGLLSDPDRLSAIRLAAYTRLSEWLPFALSIGVLRATLVELVGRPVSAGGPRLSLPAPGLPRAPASPGLPGELQELRAAVAKREIELHEFRRQLGRLQATVAGDAQAAVEIRLRTSAWGTLRRPKVSALLVARGNPGRVEATLRWLSASRMRDLELIVVGSPEEESALAAALRLCERSPRRPAVVLCDRRERGTGFARNLAASVARGGSLLILEPGDRIFPRCLEVLTGTLDAEPDVALVYPMVVRWRVDRDPDPGLGNLWGWEPDRLRRGAFLSTPYLVRRSAVARLGGYAERAELEGREDLDFLCRFADRGLRAVLAPQILAATTSLPEAELPEGPVRDQLIERAPRLLIGAGSAG